MHAQEIQVLLRGPCNRDLAMETPDICDFDRLGLGIVCIERASPGETSFCDILSVLYPSFLLI